MARLGKNEDVRVEVLAKICLELAVLSTKTRVGKYLPCPALHACNQHKSHCGGEEDTAHAIRRRRFLATVRGLSELLRNFST